MEAVASGTGERGQRRRRDRRSLGRGGHVQGARRIDYEVRRSSGEGRTRNAHRDPRRDVKGQPVERRGRGARDGTGKRSPSASPRVARRAPHRARAFGARRGERRPFESRASPRLLVLFAASIAVRGPHRYNGRRCCNDRWRCPGKLVCLSRQWLADLCGRTRRCAGAREGAGRRRWVPPRERPGSPRAPLGPLISGVSWSRLFEPRFRHPPFPPQTS